MKTTDSHNKKSISALIILLLSLTCLTVATYAWFTMSSTVEADLPEFSASAPENLQITCDNNNDGEPDSNLWASKVTADLKLNKGLLIMPASSYSGINNNIFYTENVEDGQAVAGTTFSIANRSATSAQEGYYLDVDLWIRTTGDKDVKVALDISSPSTEITDIANDDTNAGDIAQCARIAFLNPAKDKNSMGKALLDEGFNPFVYTANTSFITDGGTVVNTVDNNGSGTFVTPKYLTSDTQILSIPKNIDDPQGKGTHFVSRIWIEGQDPCCIFANGGKSFSVKLKFIALN